MAMFLLKVVEKLKQHKVPYAIAGGYALALHGVTRATVDIDLVLNLDKKNFAQFAKAMKELGLDSRLPLLPEQLIEFREEYINERNLIAWSFVNFKNPMEIVDVLLTEDLKKISSKTVQVGPYPVNVVSIDELIRMKKISNRPQDQIDIENLRRLHGKK